MADPTDPGNALLPEEDLLTDVASEFDLLFPVIPAEDEPLGPDEAIDDDEDLVDDLSDMADEELGPDQAPDLDEEEPLNARPGRDFAFDWDRSEFFVDEGGQPLMVDGDDAVIEWAMKALNTPRRIYPIYTDAYGTDLLALIGQTLNKPLLNAEVERTVREALMIHPRITQVTVESVRADPQVPDTLAIEFSIFIDDDDEPVPLSLSAAT